MSQDIPNSELDLPGEDRLMVPVHEARLIGQNYNTDIAVIVCWCEDGNRTSITTWGRNAAHKQAAADVGSLLGNGLIKAGQRMHSYQDYRREGEAAEEIDRLTQRVQFLENMLARVD